MKWPLLLLSVIALVLSPGLTLSQSKTTEPKAKESGGGRFMKDSWITTKTKPKLIADGRTKARRITVDTTDGVVTLLGKVGSEKERAAAEDVTRKVKGVKGVKNALQIVPDSSRKRWTPGMTRSRRPSWSGSRRTSPSRKPTSRCARTRVW